MGDGVIDKGGIPDMVMGYQIGTPPWLLIWPLLPSGPAPVWPTPYPYLHCASIWSHPLPLIWTLLPSVPNPPPPIWPPLSLDLTPALHLALAPIWSHSQPLSDPTPASIWVVLPSGPTPTPYLALAPIWPQPCFPFGPTFIRSYPLPSIWHLLLSDPHSQPPVLSGMGVPPNVCFNLTSHELKPPHMLPAMWK